MGVSFTKRVEAHPRVAAAAAAVVASLVTFDAVFVRGVSSSTVAAICAIAALSPISSSSSSPSLPSS